MVGNVKSRYDSKNMYNSSHHINTFFHSGSAKESAQRAEQIYHKYPLAHKSATRQQAPAVIHKVLIRVIERNKNQQFGLHLVI